MLYQQDTLSRGLLLRNSNYNKPKQKEDEMSYLDRSKENPWPPEKKSEAPDNSSDMHESPRRPSITEEDLRKPPIKPREREDGLPARSWPLNHIPGW